MEYKNLIVKKFEGFCVLSLNRPTSLNALTPEVFTELNLFLTELENDDSIFVVVLTGEGKAFAAGADISYMKDLDTLGALEFTKEATFVLRKIETMDKVFICAINGYALGGGCELSLSCDIRIASENAVLGFPETGLGIIPGYTGTQRLPRIVGVSKAKELIFTCNKIKANEALSIGLVNKVVPLDDLINESIKMAKTIAKNSALAVCCAKQSINYGIDMTLDMAIEFERNTFSRCFSTFDQKKVCKLLLKNENQNF